MKVLLVLHGYPPEEAAGTELYAEEAANALAALGHDVRVFAANPAAGRPTHRTERRGAVSVERFLGDLRAEQDGVRPLRDERVETAFAATLQRFRPDAVHVISVELLSTDLVRLAKAAAPTVVAPTDFSFACPAVHVPVGRHHPLPGRLWGLNCFAHTEARNPRWIGALLRRRRLAGRIRWHLTRADTLREALRSADLVLTPSEFVRRFYVDFGVEPNRIETLPLGLSYDHVARARRPGGPRLRVGYLGAFARDKGPDLLVAAFRDVEAPHAELVLRGRTVDPDYAAGVARAAAPDPRIELGDAIDGSVRGFLATLDLLVVPTRVHESFSRVARESFLAGVPVLAAAAGALPEIVTPGRNGALFDAGDEKDLRRSLQELVAPGALERLHDFPRIKTMDEHARELIDRYEMLAA
jgi:glycosyltransferase involved in cell wall biosynthesis